MKKFRVAIIGCGSIFPMHSMSIVSCPDAELVAVCDILEERAEKKAAEYKCNAYTDYREMIDKESLDAVHLCLPHNLHAPVAIYCMEKGIHVFCEKPLSSTREDGLKMIECAKKNGVTLACVFQNRFNHGNKLLKETLDSGKLGKIYGAKCFVTWCRTKEYYDAGKWRAKLDEAGGGVIMTQAIHTIDAMRYLLNSKAIRVDATVASRGNLGLEVEDTAEGLIEFENGVQANFHAICYYSVNSPIYVEFDCQNGVARLDGDFAKIRFNDGTVLESEPAENDSLNYGSVKTYWGVCHSKQINDFYHHLKTGDSMYISLESAWETQNLVFDIYESARTGRTVYCK